MFTILKTPSPRAKHVLVSEEAYKLVVSQSTLEDDFVSALDRMLGIPPPPPPASAPPPAVPPPALVFPTDTHTASGTTKQHLFEQPVLTVLKDLGGKARSTDVLVRIEPMLPLTQADYTPNAKGVIPWKQRAGWCVSKLRTDGKILPSKQEGVWELAPESKPEPEKK